MGSILVSTHRGDGSLHYKGRTYQFRGGKCSVRDESEARRVASAHRDLSIQAPPEAAPKKPAKAAKEAPEATGKGSSATPESKE